MTRSRATLSFPVAAADSIHGLNFVSAVSSFESGTRTAASGGRGGGGSGATAGAELGEVSSRHRVAGFVGCAVVPAAAAVGGRGGGFGTVTAILPGA